MTSNKHPKPTQHDHSARRGAKAKSSSKNPTAIAARAGSSRKVGKIEKVIALLRRPKGATITELIKATGWQAHSVRGAISGTIKKKRQLPVVSQKSGAVRTYCIAS